MSNDPALAFVLEARQAHSLSADAPAILVSQVPTLTLAKISDAGSAAGKNAGTNSGNVLLLDSFGGVSTPNFRFADGITIFDGADTTQYLHLEPYKLSFHPGPVGDASDLTRMTFLVGLDYSLKIIPGDEDGVPVIYTRHTGDVFLGNSNSGTIYFCGDSGAAIDAGGNLNLPAAGGIALNGGTFYLADASGSGGQSIEMDGGGLNHCGDISLGTNRVIAGISYFSGTGTTVFGPAHFRSVNTGEWSVDAGGNVMHDASGNLTLNGGQIISADGSGAGGILWELDGSDLNNAGNLTSLGWGLFGGSVQATTGNFINANTDPSIPQVVVGSTAGAGQCGVGFNVGGTEVGLFRCDFTGGLTFNSAGDTTFMSGGIFPANTAQMTFSGGGALDVSGGYKVGGVAGITTNTPNQDGSTNFFTNGILTSVV